MLTHVMACSCDNHEQMLVCCLTELVNVSCVTPAGVTMRVLPAGELWACTVNMQPVVWMLLQCNVPSAPAFLLSLLISPRSASFTA